MLIDHLNAISSNKAENLNLIGTFFFEGDFELFCSTLKNNTSVQTIDISFCNLIDTEIQTLAEALKVRPNLKKLNIQDNLLKNKSLAIILELISTGKVAQIEFGNNKFDKSSSEYANFLAELKKYQKNPEEEKRNSFSSQTTDESSGHGSTPPSPSLFQPSRPVTPPSDEASAPKGQLNNRIK